MPALPNPHDRLWTRRPEGLLSLFALAVLTTYSVGLAHSQANIGMIWLFVMAADARVPRLQEQRVACS